MAHGSPINRSGGDRLVREPAEDRCWVGFASPSQLHRDSVAPDARLKSRLWDNETLNQAVSWTWASLLGGLRQQLSSWRRWQLHQKGHKPLADQLGDRSREVDVYLYVCVSKMCIFEVGRMSELGVFVMYLAEIN